MVSESRGATLQLKQEGSHCPFILLTFTFHFKVSLELEICLSCCSNDMASSYLKRHPMKNGFFARRLFFISRLKDFFEQRQLKELFFFCCCFYSIFYGHFLVKLFENISKLFVWKMYIAVFNSCYFSLPKTHLARKLKPNTK